MNRFTLSVCLSLLLAATSLAQSIGVSFAGDNTGGTAVQITSAQTAGIYPQSNWNDATGGSGTVSGLVNSGGSATGASVTWSSPNVWGGTGATSDEEAMVNGWLDDGGGTGSNIDISGIAYSDYDVYVYGSSDAGNEGRGMTANVNGTSYYSGGEFTTVSANGSFFNGHVNGASADADPSYLKITDVAGATLSVIGARDGAGPALPGGGTDYRAGVSGVQVADTYGLGTASASRVVNPSDPVAGGQIVGDQFVVGEANCCDSPVNQWPGGEPPTDAFGGTGQKYLNFGKENTGVIVNPASDEVVNGIKLWSANDAIERDPASYQLYGTNETAAGAIGGALLPAGSSLPLSAFELISEGGLALPDSRNDGGGAVLDEANAQLVVFANDTAYDTYMVVFPTIKDTAAANSMQIAEIQLVSGAVVPEPSTLALMGLSLCGLLGLRRRR